MSFIAATRPSRVMAITPLRRLKMSWRKNRSFRPETLGMPV
jgi:hypothetical protein